LHSKYFIIFSFLSFLSFSQSIKDCKQRFDTYLNFRGSLNQIVKFENDAICLFDAKGRKELAIYSQELNVLASFFKVSTVAEQERLLNLKGLKKYSIYQRDSLLIEIKRREKVVVRASNLPLAGYRVAIDPGHFCTDLKEAKIEQKYLFFVNESHEYRDTVKLFESFLTFNTAKQLQFMLEKEGAEVFLTRTQNNFTSFNCTYSDWLKLHKKRMLDSLHSNELIPLSKYKVLTQLSDYKLFWEFFRDFDLLNRAQKVNQFHPDVTVIIHFNVDESNQPWKKPSEKNYTMAFVAGAFTADNLNKTESKINFLRLLLTDQVKQSEKIASETVKNFSKNLKIQIAKSRDAVYLKDNCLSTNSPGVFSRNLVLCRKINSPLVYGESLYQDNRAECKELMKCDVDVYGIKTNFRLQLVAKSYFDAVMDFFK
jgi:N-acetylmuramoyl-L-alanine amidase